MQHLPGTSHVLIRACWEHKAVPPFKFSLRVRTVTSRSSHGLAQHSAAVAGRLLQIEHAATCMQRTVYVAVGYAYAVGSTVQLMAVLRLLLENAAGWLRARYDDNRLMPIISAPRTEWCRTTSACCRSWSLRMHWLFAAMEPSWHPLGDSRSVEPRVLAWERSSQWAADADAGYGLQSVRKAPKPVDCALESGRAASARSSLIGSAEVPLVTVGIRQNCGRSSPR